MSSNDSNDLDYLESIARQAKVASAGLRTVLTHQKNTALHNLAALLEKHRTEIKKINERDVGAARDSGIAAPLVERLIISDKTIDSMIQSVKEIAAFKDPVGDIIEGYTLANGLRLQKRRIPIGVLAVIYESRPNVTVDVGALGLKSSNAVILRGGKEAIHSNTFLAELFSQALESANLPSAAISLITRTDRSLITPLTQLNQYIDIIVPRGGEALIKAVSESATIPVIKHDKGTCHIFVHQSCDYELARDVVINSKTQRPSVCNAAESLLIDTNWPHTTRLLSDLIAAGVMLHSDEHGIEKAKTCLPSLGIEPLTEDGFGAEYLDLAMSISFHQSIDNAIAHIQTYSSGHTEAILARDIHAIEKFKLALDSAAIMVNCSTRFHDGGQFGLGAEVGIANGKLHVRGPMGLNDLTTMQYQVTGEGQIRT